MALPEYDSLAKLECPKQSYQGESNKCSHLIWFGGLHITNTWKTKQLQSQHVNRTTGMQPLSSSAIQWTLNCFKLHSIEFIDHKHLN